MRVIDSDAYLVIRKTYKQLRRGIRVNRRINSHSGRTVIYNITTYNGIPCIACGMRKSLHPRCAHNASA